MVVKRQQVVSEKGRRWAAGRLDSRDYFDEAWEEARQLAKEDVEKRLRKRVSAGR